MDNLLFAIKGLYSVAVMWSAILLVATKNEDLQMGLKVFIAISLFILMAWIQADIDW